MNPRRLHLVLTIRGLTWISALGILLSFGACQNEDPLIPDVIRPVRSEVVFFSNAEQIRTFSGVSKAGLEASLSFKVSGTVKKLLVQVGDKVKKNQRLAEIDPKDFRLGGAASGSLTCEYAGGS